MCGIAGIASFHKNVIDATVLASMSKAIHHRGPDEEGSFVAPGVGLAIQRLKVIDLSTGHQPIFNETKDVVTVFNGEIYNYKELRDELKANGHTFTTQSDTETIVHLYEEYGESFPSKLNGMFAIALWDKKKEKLLLVRDRAGIKPLFYSVLDDVLLFGSEIKCLLTYPGFPKTIDYEAFEDYLSYYYIIAPKTIYKHMKRLPPGHMLVLEKGTHQIKEYWDLRYETSASLSFDDAKNEFTNVLDVSIKRHLQSDVPVGVFLSGGLDSASIVAMVSHISSRVRTYTIGYEEESYSELGEAKTVAELFKTDHSAYVMTASDMVSNLSTVVQQMDEPNGDWSSVPHYLVAKHAKKDVTVVLNGAGGDELFGGYPTLIAARAALLYQKLPAFVRSQVIERVVNALPATNKRMSFDFIAKSFVRGASAPLEEAHRRFKEIFSKDERDTLLKTTRAHRDHPQRIYEQFTEKSGKYKAMDRLMYLDFKVFLPHCPLYVSDITTSAHALEGRVPFLDQEMVDFASRVPWQMKTKGHTTKYLMREAMKKFLPSSITSMRKKGFLVPGSVWIKKELKPLIMDAVGRAKKDLSNVFNFTFVDQLLDDHFNGRADHTRRISCLVSFFLWHEAAKPVWGPDVQK